MSNRIILQAGAVIVSVFLLYGSVTARLQIDLEQVVLTPTTVQIQIATTTPLPTIGQPPTQAPPTFTPTDVGPPQLEVPADSELPINVRADADIDSAILGSIRPGERYVVTGRVFRWLQIRFDPSPSGRAYVFEDLVTIVGDPDEIPDLTLDGLPTLQDNTFLNQTATAEALRLTPGFVETQAQDIQEIEIPSGNVDEAASGVPESDQGLQDGVPVVLPTFTYPSNLPTRMPTQDTLADATPTEMVDSIAVPAIEDGLAPIVPIVVLASVGLIGLMLSALFR